MLNQLLQVHRYIKNSTTQRVGIILILNALWIVSFGQSNGEMALIRGGSYIPLYGNDTVEVTVEDFLFDKYPVTNAEFLAFVKQNSRWQKSKVKKIFAEENYLSLWKSDTVLSAAAMPRAPVTYVSWFAAKNYCQSRGMRLPTMDEWEYVGMADDSAIDARKDSVFHSQILEWYEKPTAKIIPVVGNTAKNYWGVYGMHGLVWEWVSDFNTVLLTGESRNDVDVDSNLFCAGSALGSTDLMNYAAFMRYAFRGSLKANYTIKNLGFRCAGDLTNQK